MLEDSSEKLLDSAEQRLTLAYRPLPDSNHCDFPSRISSNARLAPIRFRPWSRLGPCGTQFARLLDHQITAPRFGPFSVSPFSISFLPRPAVLLSSETEPCDMLRRAQECSSSRCQ